MQSAASASDRVEGWDDDGDEGAAARRAAPVLLVADAGDTAQLVEAVLVARGYRVTRVSTTEADLFSRALGQEAIVFLPASNLLSAQLAQGAGGEVVHEVLRASRAPGVGLVVAALPEARGFDAIVDAIARSGKPYIVVRTPGLMEEVAETIRHGERTLWLPRAGRIPVSRGSALAEAVVSALESEHQGRVLSVASESFDVAGLFAAASDIIGGQVRVRAVTPLIYRVVRPVARWLKGGEPAPLAIADQLLARQARGPGRAAFAS